MAVSAGWRLTGGRGSLRKSFLPAGGVSRVLSSSPPPLSLSALRDTRLRGKEAEPGLWGMLGPWGRGAEAAEAAPRAGVGGLPSPLGVVSRTEVREGMGRLGLLPSGRKEAAPGWWAWASCGPLGAASERWSWGTYLWGCRWDVQGGTEQGEESPKTPSPQLSPTCYPQHLLLEEMDEMGNWPPE